MLGSSRNIWTLCSTILITVSAVVSSLILMVMTSMSWSNTLMNIFTSFFILEINLQSKHVWQLLNSTCLLSRVFLASPSWLELLSHSSRVR